MEVLHVQVREGGRWIGKCKRVEHIFMSGGVGGKEVACSSICFSAGKQGLQAEAPEVLYALACQ
jgi:hypothetical protein